MSPRFLARGLGGDVILGARNTSEFGRPSNEFSLGHGEFELLWNFWIEMQVYAREGLEM